MWRCIDYHIFQVDKIPILFGGVVNNPLVVARHLITGCSRYLDAALGIGPSWLLFGIYRVVGFTSCCLHLPCANKGFTCICMSHNQQTSEEQTNMMLYRPLYHYLSWVRKLCWPMLIHGGPSYTTRTPLSRTQSLFWYCIIMLHWRGHRMSSHLYREHRNSAKRKM